MCYSKHVKRASEAKKYPVLPHPCKNKASIRNLTIPLTAPQCEGGSVKVPANAIVIITWNLNTLSSPSALTNLLGSVHGHSPNVLCIQETLLTKQMQKQFTLAGFQLFFSPADSTKPNEIERRGLLTAVSTHLIAKPLPSTSSIISGNLVESQSTEILTTDGPISLHNVYIHHKNDNKSLKLKATVGKHVITGDFNARHVAWETGKEPTVSTARGNKLYSLIQESPNLLLCNNPSIPTTINNTTLTLSIISSELAPVTDWEVLSDCVGAPHLATCTTLNIAPPAVAPPFKPKLKFEKADWNMFDRLSDNPEAISNYLNPDATLDNICHSVIDNIEEATFDSIPRTKPHSTIPAYQCWWYNEECKKAKIKLNRAVSDNRKNLPGAKTNLRRVRFEASATFEKAKHQKWNEICQSFDLSSSLGSHWRRLRWLYNGGSPPSPILMELAKAKATADKAMTSFSDRSHRFNLNQATKLVLDELTPVRQKSILLAISDDTGLCSKLFNMEELDEALIFAKNSTPGEDEIYYVLLSHLGQATKNQLLHLYNCSLALKKSPAQWKIIPIVPVPKKEEGEFRPIALLSCLAKVMERMILSRLRFLIGPLHPNLLGSTKGKGTTDAIATLTKMASDAKYNRSGPKTNALKICLAIFIDFEKAFELANITSLLSILCNDKGIKGNILGWIQEYLLNRKGYTCVQGIKSETMPLYQGTPQGSVLSPYLFNIIIDKLLNMIYRSLPSNAAKNVSINSYADDIVLVSNHWNAKNNLDLALKGLELGSMILGLKVNLKKTKAMAWNHSLSFPSYHYTVYDSKIEWVRTFKYLGVTFDDNLSFTKHVEDVLCRASKRLNVLKHLAGSPYGATQQTLLHYVKACIRPILEYGSVALLIACPSAIKRLETFHNTALRIALRVPKHTRTKLLLVESGCTSLEARIISLSMVAMAKIRAYPCSHPYFQSGREMHMSSHPTSRMPKNSRDMPLDLVLETLESTYRVPIITPIELPNIPPHIPHIKKRLRFDIKPLSKSKLSLSEAEKFSICHKFTEHIAKNFENHCHIYVDGAKDPETGKAGAGLVLSRNEYEYTKHFRLSNGISSTQAELAAIYLSLVTIRENQIPDPKIVIHCDSLPSILTLKHYNPDPLNPQVQLIFQVISVLHSRPDFELWFHWIPSHINIEGNERADRQASLGMQLPHVTYITPPTIGQIKSTIREELKCQTGKWFADQNPESAYQKYLTINPSLKQPPQISKDPSTQQWINRLKMETDTWCYQHSVPTACGYCNHPFSAQHYLVDCPVTASVDFLESLTEREHSLSSKEKAQCILRSLYKTSPNLYFIKSIQKRFPKVKCPHPEHGSINSFHLKIPKGL